MTLSADLLALVRCPRCRGQLDQLTCLTCRTTYPSVNDVPILLDESRSMFRAEDVKDGLTGSGSGLGRFLPRISANLKAAANYRKLAAALPGPRVLVIGGRILGEGAEALLESKLDLIETDIALGPRTQIVCDAHALPFADASFDGVVAQAVLEHVIDPARCVAEMHRVLRDDGLVYAETPFMQQVHAGAYDYTRFTHLGHRRLFRAFHEVESGAACGPGMALAWSFTNFLQSFARSKLERRIARLAGHLTTFPLKYLDPLVIDRPGSLDAASAVYFLGRKAKDVLPDKELPRYYRGADQR